MRESTGILRWLQCHGLTLEGLRCITAACQGAFALHTRKRKTKDGKTEEHATLRCTSCHKETSARGEFFGHYKGSHLTEAMQLLYAVAERWRPQQVLQELSIRDRARFVSMMDHTGKINLSVLPRGSLQGKPRQMGISLR